MNDLERYLYRYHLTNNYDELIHYGVKGQKWGVRRTPEQLGHRESRPNKSTKEDTKMVSNIANNFRVNKWGSYASEFKANIGGEKVHVEVMSSGKGNEIADATAAVNFLKRYDVAKAKEGVTKYFYEDDYGSMGLDKDHISRDDFKKRISPYGVYIDPKLKVYTVGWDDDGMYGGHSLDDEGNLDTMKVYSRSMNG